MDNPIPNVRSDIQVVQNLVVLALFWVMADLAYYFALPALGYGADYNDYPVEISIFYLFWVGLAGIYFWPLYARWPEFAPWPTLSDRRIATALWTIMFAAAIIYIRTVIPNMSPSTWPEGNIADAPDIIVATADYFLPKSIEILFQQLLVLALVLTLSAAGRPLLQVVITCSALFGVMHLLMILGGTPLRGVLVFSISATVFGALMPMLILRVRYGLALSVVMHWSFYAVIVQIARTAPHPGLN